jgi:hypothetical protein
VGGSMNVHSYVNSKGTVSGKEQQYSLGGHT